MMTAVTTARVGTDFFVAEATTGYRRVRLAEEWTIHAHKIFGAFEEDAV